jgi:adhesin HecA-like repeat protein
MTKLLVVTLCGLLFSGLFFAAALDSTAQADGPQTQIWRLGQTSLTLTAGALISGGDMTLRSVQPVRGDAPFIVGEAATNGVTGTLTTGDASLSPSQSFLFSHFEPPNIWIISVTPTLVINEIMKNPAAVNDAEGEWLELYNAGPAAMNLDGCILRDDDTDFHRIDNGGPLLIEAGGYLVLGLNGDSAANGNVPVGYDYDFYFLNNDTDEIVLECGGVEIDRVNYDNGITFPDPTGASMQLVAPTLDNNLGANWCESLLPWPGSAGDLGTPGAINNCLPEPLPDIPLTIYLPVISKSQPPPPPAPVTPPDLVVEQLMATTNAVTVVIKNSGTEPVVDAFWVDLYLDPAPPPTGVNQTWQTLADQGVAWGVVAPDIPLEAQGLLTLTLTSPYLVAAESDFNLPLPEGLPVWVQVDSINLATDYGGVLESHEISGGAYNNITSTVVISGPVVTIPPLEDNQRGAAPGVGLPGRD